MSQLPELCLSWLTPKQQGLRCPSAGDLCTFGALYGNLNPYYLESSTWGGKSTWKCSVVNHPVPVGRDSGLSVTPAGDHAKCLCPWRWCTISEEGLLLGSWVNSTYYPSFNTQTILVNGQGIYPSFRKSSFLSSLGRGEPESRSQLCHLVKSSKRQM